MEQTLGTFLRRRREEMGIGCRELCRLMAKSSWTGGAITNGYLSRIESGEADSSKVSIDTLWKIGMVLKIDPLYLFVLSRPQMDKRFLDKRERESYFRI